MKVIERETEDRVYLSVPIKKSQWYKIWIVTYALEELLDIRCDKRDTILRAIDESLYQYVADNRYGLMLPKNWLQWTVEPEQTKITIKEKHFTYKTRYKSNVKSSTTIEIPFDDYDVLRFGAYCIDMKTRMFLRKLLEDWMESHVVFENTTAKKMWADLEKFDK